MDFSVGLTRKDIYISLLYNTYRSYPGIMSVVAGVLLIVMANVYPGLSDFFRSALIVFGILFPVSKPFTLLRTAQKTVLQMEQIQKKDVYRLDEDAMMILHNKMETKILWNKMYKVVEKKEYFYVYAAPTRFMVVPKRELSTEICDNFRDMLREHNVNIVCNDQEGITSLINKNR